MSIELRLLAYSVALLFVLVLIQATAGVRAQGLAKMAGNRDDLGAPSTYQARTKRIVDNHREGLMIFAPLVLIAAVAHISNEWTELGARLFFYGRLAHAIIYLLGLPWLRPLVWTAGLVGIVLIFLSLFGLLQ